MDEIERRTLYKHGHLADQGKMDLQPLAQRMWELVKEKDRELALCREREEVGLRQLYDQNFSHFVEMNDAIDALAAIETRGKGI